MEEPKEPNSPLQHSDDPPLPKQILIVDDDVTFAEMLQDILDEYGQEDYDYQSDVVHSGLACLEYCREELPDLILLDVVMPGMNGVELADRVSGMLPTVPVIFVSGYAEEIAGVEAMRRRGALFIPKPFDPTLLLLSVRETLDAVPLRPAD